MSRRHRIRRNVVSKVGLDNELTSSSKLANVGTRIYSSSSSSSGDTKSLTNRGDISCDIKRKTSKYNKIRSGGQSRRCKIEKIDDIDNDDNNDNNDNNDDDIVNRTNSLMKINSNTNINNAALIIDRHHQETEHCDDFETFQPYRQIIGDKSNLSKLSGGFDNNSNNRNSLSDDNNDDDDDQCSLSWSGESSPDDCLRGLDTVEETCDIFAEYRKECEQLIRSSATQIDKERYVTLLETIVADLLEQNQCLTENLTEIRKEANNRVKVMHQKLEKSAKRTEETMLSLQSHELQLKEFVQRHCCQCCGCDMRLMEFRLCHGVDGGDQCWTNHDIEFLSGPTEINNGCHQQSTTTFQQTRYPRCSWQYGTEWNLIVSQVQNWVTNRSNRSSSWWPSIDPCAYHQQSSQIRFIDLIDRVNTRIQQLELDNDEMKQENQLIRELNSLLSGRKGHLSVASSTETGSASSVGDQSVQTTERIQPLIASTYPEDLTHRHRRSRLASIDSDSLSLNQLFNNEIKDSSDEHHTHNDHDDDNDHHLNQDLITFLSKSAKHDLLSSYLGESQLEMNDHQIMDMSCCESSRSESMNSRQDNDSGCSTDLIPSQTDMHSLLSDCEDTIETVLSSIHAEVKEVTRSQDQTGLTSDNNSNNHNVNIDQLRAQLGQAQRLVPKLYNKLLFYLTQRNQLLRQFQHENRERKKCKQELSSLVDCLVLGLKGVETNSKLIKQLQLSSSPLSY